MSFVRSLISKFLIFGSFNDFINFPLKNFKFFVFTSCNMFLCCRFLIAYKTSRKVTDWIAWLISFVTNLQVISTSKSWTPVSKTTYCFVLFNFCQRILLVFCYRKEKSLIFFVSFEIGFILRIIFSPIQRSVSTNNLVTFSSTESESIGFIITNLVKFFYWKMMITCPVE